MTGREQTEAPNNLIIVRDAKREPAAASYTYISTMKNTCSDGSHRVAPGGWCSASVIYICRRRYKYVYIIVISSLTGKLCDAEKLCVATVIATATLL